MARPDPTRWPRPTEPKPSSEELSDMIFDVTLPTATDGCDIEPDGVCPHGHPSWLLVLGFV